MKRAELIDELERLGSSPAPVPDRGRISAWEHQLYLAFEPAPAPSGHVLRPPRARIRRRRRQLLVAGLAVAAAASAAVVAVHRSGRPDLELQAASGAVVVLPDGSTMPIHPGDRIPPGGVIHTGANGSVTVDGTRVGPGQTLLVDNGHLTLLPATSPTVVPVAPAPTPAPTASAPPATRPAKPRTTPSRSSPPPVGASPASNAPPRAAATPSTAPAPAASPPATTAAPAPPNASAPTPVGGVLGLTVGRVGSGIQLSWTSPNVASFGRYVIARASVSPVRLIGIAVLTDEQITSFIDPAAPHGVEVFYRVVALGRDDRLIAKSEIVSLIVEQSAPTTTTTVPSSSPSTTSVPTTTNPQPSTTTSTTTTSTTSTTMTTTTTPTTSTPPTTTASSLPATSEPASTEAWRPHR